MKKMREKGLPFGKCLAILCLLFLLPSASPVQAATGGQELQRVTLSLQQAGIKELFAAIRRQTNYNFVYSDDQMDRLAPLTIRVENERVDRVLERVFSATPYTFTIEGNAIAIVARPEGAPQGQALASVSGKVTDAGGLPCPGVTVQVRGTSYGTVTNAGGEYVLRLLPQPNTVLSFSFIGMQTREIPYRGETVVDVVMQEEDVSLSDVVVIGYGTKSQRDVTSSVSSLKSEEMERYNNGTFSFDNLIGGAIKGVRVIQGSGKPGDGASINVRGITSPISNQGSYGINEPLYVIDGMPFFLSKSPDAINPLLTLSPGDIESIDVLKDAAATAIYGSRGANGVIIVNTKKGRRNEQVRISAGYTLSVGNPIKKYKPLNTQEFKSLTDRIIRNTLDAVERGQMDPWMVSSIPGMYDDPVFGTPNFGVTMDFDEYYNPVYTYQLNEEAFGDADTDWVKETANKNALTHQYNVGLRGGSERTNYHFSFYGVNQEGLYIQEKLERYGARLSLDSDISWRLKGGAALSYTYSKRNLGEDYSYMGATKEWIARPDVPVYNSEGEYAQIDGSTIYGFPVNLGNPVALRQRDNTSKGVQFMGSGYFALQLIKDLTLRGEINISRFETEGGMFTPTFAQDDYSFYGIPVEASLQASGSMETNTSVNFRADYSRTFGLHKASGMIGVSWDRTFRESSGISYYDFPDDYILTNISSAARAEYYSGTKSESGLNSVYGRLSYSYAGRYLAEANFRADESSKFGPGNRWGLFPSLSVGWRISDESFLREVKAVNDLKLRLSVGSTGSTNVADFAFKQFFSRSSTSLYGGNAAIVLSSQYPNRDIKWEMTTEFNAGLDFSLFTYRLYGSLDVYSRKTKGALAPAPVPKETGATTSFSNLMDLSNRGMELEIGGDLIRTDQVSWMAKLNIAFNRNKLEKLNDANISSYQISYYKEGEPIGILIGYKVEKIFETDEEVALLNAQAAERNPDASYYQNASTGAGDFKYRDLNGDGYITADDREVIASPEAKFFGGFSSAVTWRGWSLSCGMQFSQGTKAELSELSTGVYGTLGQSVYRDLYEKSWTPDNRDARYARLVAYDPSSNSRRSDRYIHNSSYLRLKNLTLSYTLPAVFLERVNIRHAQVFVSGSNLFTWTKWPGLDPELVSTSRGVLGQTVNEDIYPLSKTFSLGVRLEF